jgi:hypothetical protein
MGCWSNGWSARARDHVAHDPGLRAEVFLRMDSFSFTAADIIMLFSLTAMRFSYQSTSLPIRISFDISGA